VDRARPGPHDAASAGQGCRGTGAGAGLRRACPPHETPGRLCARTHRLSAVRTHHCKVTPAVARELVGVIGAIAGAVAERPHARRARAGEMPKPTLTESGCRPPGRRALDHALRHSHWPVTRALRERPLRDERDVGRDPTRDSRYDPPPQSLPASRHGHDVVRSRMMP